MKNEKWKRTRNGKHLTMKIKMQWAETCETWIKKCFCKKCLKLRPVEFLIINLIWFILSTFKWVVVSIDPTWSKRSPQLASLCRSWCLPSRQSKRSTGRDRAIVVGRWRGIHGVVQFAYGPTWPSKNLSTWLILLRTTLKKGKAR